MLIKMRLRPEIKYYQKKPIKTYFQDVDIDISEHAFKRGLNGYFVRPFTAHQILEVLGVPEGERKALIEYIRD